MRLPVTRRRTPVAPITTSDRRRSPEYRFRPSVPVKPRRGRATRRAVLLGGSAAALATAFGALELLKGHAVLPEREAAASELPSDVQFDLGHFMPAATTLAGIQVKMPTLHT